MTNRDELLRRRVEKILPSREGLENLISKKKIRLYQGFDPTGSRLHLGHTIGLRKLMDFARAGHEVIFLFGTGTVLVGDPSERDTGRKLITQEEIDQNIKDWKSQVSPIVDFSLSNVKILQNGDWLTKLTLKEIVNIASKISAIQLFKRKSFTRRIDKGDTVWYHETMYPLLQGYDSVAMNVDLEIGGTDQEFNMLVGRELQAKMNNREKFVLTVPMILGTDGKQMSKTSGNCIWLDSSPEDMYGGVMSIQDDLISNYFELLTDAPSEEIRSLDPSQPVENKKKLAHTIVTEIHGTKAADSAAEFFERTIQKGEAPKDIPELEIDENNPTAIAITAVFASNASISERKRMIRQGGFEQDGNKITDPNLPIDLTKGNTFRYGKRGFYKIKKKK